MPLSKPALSALTDTTIFENTSELISATNVNVLIKDIIDAMALESDIPTSTSFTGGTVSGATQFTGGLTANTFSATTYQNLPQDIFVSGGTYSAGTATFTNTSGGTFNVTGFSTGTTLTGPSTQVLYFDASGNTTSDSGFTRTANSLNIESDFSGIKTSIYEGNNLLGFGINGIQIGATANDGLNGLASGDLTPFGLPINTTIVGNLNLAGFFVNTNYTYNPTSHVSKYVTEIFDGSGHLSMNFTTTNGFSIEDDNSSVNLFKVNTSGALTLNNAYTFPTADGASGNTLQTDGSGNLSWEPFTDYTPIYPFNQIVFGDGSTNGGITSSAFTFDNNTTSLQVLFNGDPCFNILPASKLYAIGDIDNVMNGCSFRINDDSRQISITSPSGVTAMGDTAIIGNSTIFSVNDINQSFTLNKANININALSYVFPSVQGASNTTLINDGSGNLTWNSPVHNVPVTSAQTSTYNILATDYLITVNTSSSITINLPASPNNGDTYIIKDSTGNGLLNNITINGNGHNIDGTSTATINMNFGSMTVIYSTSANIWLII